MATEQDWEDEDFIGLDEFVISRDTRSEAHDTVDDVKDKLTVSQLEDFSAQRSFQKQESSSSELASNLGRRDHWPPWKNLSGPTNTGSYHHYHREPYHHYHREPPGLVKLHNEIVDFVTLMEPWPEEIEERETIIREVTDLVQKTFGGSDRVFGSNATSLFLPHSDIDLVVYFNGDDSNTLNQAEVSAGTPARKKSLTTSQQERIDMDNWCLHDSIASQQNKSHYTMLAEALQQEWGTAKLSYLEVIENTRVPLVKFTHRPSNISVDVCFNQEGGPEAAAMMNQWLKDLPPLRPLCLLLKYFLSSRGLNETYTGGIGSYALQLMIISFLQHRAREESSIRRSTLASPENSGNLGSMLLEFLELYGLDFNYITTGISLRHGGYYFPKGARDKKPIFWLPSRPFSVAIENPRDPLHDVGKGSYRMIQIQKAFDIAFRTILAYTSEPIVPTQSILATILPPTKDMVKRSVWLDLPHDLEQHHNGHDRSKRSNKRRRGSDEDPRRTGSSSDEDLNKRMKRRDNAGGYDRRPIHSSLQNSSRGYRS